MAGQKSKSTMSVEEYLRFEEKSMRRHEYVDGHVFAMTGASNRHNAIIGNLYFAIRGQLDAERSGCRIYFTDVKVRVEANNSFYYPDLLISCGLYEPNSFFAEKPVLIAEVLSPSTASIDRREKLLAYKQVESLKEYMIVFQRQRKVQVHRRLASANWETLEYLAGQIELNAIELHPISILLDDIYKNSEPDSRGDDLRVREEIASWDPTTRELDESDNDY